MKSILLQTAGMALILLCVGIWWILDLYGCAFNTAGCSRVLPNVSMGAIAGLALPVAFGTSLILAGRWMR